MLRWERVPILGNNPVFCYDARRIWTRRTVLISLLVLVAIMVVTYGIFGLLSQRTTSYAFAIVRQHLWRVLPPQLPLTEQVRQASAALGWEWWARTWYVVMLILGWVTHLASRYILPALGAVSFPADRSRGHLTALLATPMSLRQILVGKIAALALPFLLLWLTANAAAIPMSFIRGTPVAQYALGRLEGILFLLVLTMIGLCLGACIRQPAVALGASVFLAGVLLPYGIAELSSLAATALAGPEFWAGPGQRATPPHYHTYARAAQVATHAVMLIVLWLSTKRALARIAE